MAGLKCWHTRRRLTLFLCTYKFNLPSLGINHSSPVFQLPFPLLHRPTLSSLDSRPNPFPSFILLHPLYFPRLQIYSAHILPCPLRLLSCHFQLFHLPSSLFFV